MSRRSFLLLSGRLAALVAAARLGEIPTVQAQATPMTKLAPVDRALLNRLTWGLNTASADLYISKGRDAFIAQQLKPAQVKLPAAVQKRFDNMVLSNTSIEALTRRIRAGQGKIGKAANDAMAQKERVALRAFVDRLEQETLERSLLRCLHSPHQFQERLTWFWCNHFNIDIRKSLTIRALVSDFEEKAIRPHVFGRFEDLLIATVKHPAMLMYLDNIRNRAGRINENYGRELMELHTLGVGGGYKQADVLALSRVLTGLRINDSEDKPKLAKIYRAAYVRDGLFEFNPMHHDNQSKTLLGQQIDPGGMDEVELVIRLLARHPSTARHIAQKLATYFVADTPPATLVAAMAKSYSQSDGNLSAVLRTMLSHRAFQASLEEKDFKDPMRYVLSGMRMFYPQEEDMVINTRLLAQWLGVLGERPFSRVTPDGYPIRRSEWQGSGQMAARIDIAQRMAAGPAQFFYEDAPPKGAKPRVPRSGKILYERMLANDVHPTTEKGLRQARDLNEWNALWLASPDFMYA